MISHFPVFLLVDNAYQLNSIYRLPQNEYLRTHKKPFKGIYMKIKSLQI